MERRLLTAGEVSGLTGLPRYTLWALARARRMPVVTIGRNYFWDRQALEVWIAQGGELRHLPDPEPVEAA